MNFSQAKNSAFVFPCFTAFLKNGFRRGFIQEHQNRKSPKSFIYTVCQSIMVKPLPARSSSRFYQPFTRKLVPDFVPGEPRDLRRECFRFLVFHTINKWEPIELNR